MPVVPFDPIAQSLEATLSSLTGKMRNQLVGARGAATVATNSSLVESRAAPLVTMLRERGVESLEGLTVADLGCGFGSLSLYFAAQGATVVGLDPKAGPLRVGRAVAAEHDLPAVFARAPMQALELSDERFDVVVQNNSLCYVVDRDERRNALAETYRILRPGGWLVSRNPNRWFPVDHFTRLPLVPLLPPRAAARLARLGRGPRPHVRLVSPLAARRELHRAGFVDVKIASASKRRPAILARYVGRYQHVTARRPLVGA